MKTPLQHHRQRHRKRPEPFETCRRCLFDKAVCERKIRFHTYAEADEWALEFNRDNGWKPPLMDYYRCRWCPGWHMNKAKDKRARARTQRVFGRWVIQLAAQDRDALLHWVRTGEVPRDREEVT